MKTTLLIPGKWKDLDGKDSAVERIARTREYLFIGMIMQDLTTKDFFEASIDSMDWQGEDPLDFFNVARHEPLSHKNFDLTSDTPIFTLTCESGSVAVIEKLVKAVSFLLKLGGIGVKITNGGNFLTREEWNSSSFPSLAALFEAFVVIYNDENGVFTVGMGNFGLKDVFAPLVNDKDSANLVRIFAFYILSEKPTIKVGETFSIEPNAPCFKIIEIEDSLFPAEDPYWNPYGRWALFPVEWTI